MSLFTKKRKLNPEVYNQYISMGFDEDTASRLTIQYLKESLQDNPELITLLNSVSANMDKNAKLKRRFGLSK